MLYVVAQVGNERYAIDVAQVEEVIPFVHLTGLSGAPPGIAGVIDYYGAPVPVLDLSQATAGTATPASMSARIVVIRHGPASEPGQLTGLLVPRASDVVRCDPGEFVRAAVDGPDRRHRWDVLPDARGVVQRLDLSALLAHGAQAAGHGAEDAS